MLESELRDKSGVHGPLTNISPEAYCSTVRSTAAFMASNLVVIYFFYQLRRKGIGTRTDSLPVNSSNDITAFATAFRSPAKVQIGWPQSHISTNAPSIQTAYSYQRDRSFRSIVTAAHELMLRGQILMPAVTIGRYFSPVAVFGRSTRSESPVSVKRWLGCMSGPESHWRWWHRRPGHDRNAIIQSCTT